ncbi:RidA family protein [Paenibacillus humicola]|uniref:RidA family protein n=1 Tax=Paenibacillus humicola TaxID=3110540 RepID=UPI00237A7D53|nr:RidA family protein [Paenibacillus humicola]
MGSWKRELTAAEGYQFARSAGLEVLAMLRSGLGSLDQVKRVVKVEGIVNSVPEFERPNIVLNGFSDLMREVFGKKGAKRGRCRERTCFGKIQRSWPA